MKIENCKLKIILYSLSFALCALTLNFSLFTFHLNQALSATSADDNWSIDIKDIKINSTTPTPIPKPNQTSTEKALKENPDLYNSSFSFNISNSLIDFGILSPTNPIYRTTNITLSRAINSSLLIGYEDHPLSSSNGKSFIPNTTCDNGSCSPLTAALWENTLTFGFGYRCDNVVGNLCPADFTNNDFYKNFSDHSKNQQPEILRSNNSVIQTQESQITYKVNISKSQPHGSYSNSITYIAVPGY